MSVLSTNTNPLIQAVEPLLKEFAWDSIDKIEASLSGVTVPIHLHVLGVVPVNVDIPVTKIEGIVEKVLTAFLGPDPNKTSDLTLTKPQPENTQSVSPAPVPAVTLGTVQETPAPAAVSQPVSGVQPTSSSVPALSYNDLGEPVDADQDRYVQWLMAGAATFGNGVLDQSKPLGKFDPNGALVSGHFAGIKQENLTDSTMAALSAFGITPVGKSWQYSSAGNTHA